MIVPDRILDEVLKGLFVRDRKDTPKMTTIIIQADDRVATRSQLVGLLTRKKIRFQQIKIPGSGFEGLRLLHSNRDIRILFKEISSSKAGLMTAISENAQCIYLAAAQFKRSKIDASFVTANIKKFESNFDIDTSVDKILANLDAGWIKSLELIANHVYPKLRGSNYVFHRNSRSVQMIYKKYSELNKETKLFNHPDKWNPADIWAIQRGWIPNMNQIKSFDELNTWMREAIDKGIMIPISLKKVTKNPKIATVNTNEAMQSASSGVIAARTIYKDFVISTGKSDWTSSKNVKINMMKGSTRMNIEIRQSKGGAVINGEMKINNNPARHGKLNFEHAFQKIFKELGQRIEIPEKAKLNHQSKICDPELVRKVFDLATKLDHSSTIKFDVFQTFIGTKSKEDPDWLASKYEGMLVLEAFSKMSDKDKQKACERLYSQASAANELAGPFLKVSQA